MDRVGRERDDRVPLSVEWPTLIVAGCIAAGLGAVVLVHDRLPLPITLVLLALLGAWYGSLQHEVVHGHPTPWPRLNVSLVGAPLGLVYPFWLYRADHIEHHATSELTDPDLDPESAYLHTTDWDTAPQAAPECCCVADAPCSAEWCSVRGLRSPRSPAGSPDT